MKPEICRHGVGFQSINDHRDRQFTPSGTVLGIGNAITYLCGADFSTAGVAPEDVSTAPLWPLLWNLAKRLMIENFSNSCDSTFKSKMEARFSSLHHKPKYDLKVYSKIKDHHKGQFLEKAAKDHLFHSALCRSHS